MYSYVPKIQRNPSRNTSTSGAQFHNDTESHQAARELRAKAFTVGDHIYFGKNQYQPGTQEGQKLIAHEMTHVMQQKSMPQPMIQRTIGDELDLESPRFSGNEKLEAAFDNEILIDKHRNRVGEHVTLIQLALIELGFELPSGADGKFGTETERAVRAFQKSTGLNFQQQDGIIGPNTMSRLDSRFTEGSAFITESRCEDGIRTIPVEALTFAGFNDSPQSFINAANAPYTHCCIHFELKNIDTVNEVDTRRLFGGCLTFVPSSCTSATSRHERNLLNFPPFASMTAPFKVLFVGRLHSEGTVPDFHFTPATCPEEGQSNEGRLRGHSKGPKCAKLGQSPLAGFFQVAQEADLRTMGHEFAHYLMNVFAEHSVTNDNIQSTSNDSTASNITDMQCDIMYTQALLESL